MPEQWAPADACPECGRWDSSICRAVGHMPERPEHEEARRLAQELQRNPGKMTDSQWQAAHDLLALLSKAEQERDEQKRHADSAFKEAERYLQLHRIDAKRAEAAERELERLREALERISNFDYRGNESDQQIAIDALSADTQRESHDSCPEGHVFPPAAKTGDPCHCGKAAW